MQRKLSRRVRIVDFAPDLAHHFRELNEEWLLRYFSVERVDAAILGDPFGAIIAPGGLVLFAEEAGAIVGTCALLPVTAHSGRFELTKMAVRARSQGNGIGRALLTEALARFRKLGGTHLHLETNSQLLAAIHLYETVGFRKVERPHPSVYARADVYMIYDPPAS